ncbi:hypothetical protein [Methanoplanus limicola]|uniref:Uncharacterized protein n=1 Tax=Methanoplanus limicola DSM 2279 TaxID=937775 RepID=H1Z2V0_9EURY|nr:hypothetical protein [Methanoplanus limicola]EHQ34689.1 hypothetical protein Metlim_0555 [Methanoplanus limicola DSM 2279]
MNSKAIVILILAGFIFLALILPASADITQPTETKIFFEKDGEPYNKSVTYTVKCYGYILKVRTQEWKDYLSGNYEKRETGTYNMTEVFSYSATVDNYGDSIYEPFYYNHRVIDHCTLCGKAGGVEFTIENIGDIPNPDCNYLEYNVYRDYHSGEYGPCLMTTDESDACNKEQSRLISEGYDLCREYFEEYDENKIYPEGTRTFEMNNTTMVWTEEYYACNEEVRNIDLNCSDLLETVPCEDYCNPEGQPIRKEGSLHYTIPTDEDGNIIKHNTEKETQFAAEEKIKPENIKILTADNITSSQNLRNDTDDSFFTAILKFLGLRN